MGWHGARGASTWKDGRRRGLCRTAAEGRRQAARCDRSRSNSRSRSRCEGVVPMHGIAHGGLEKQGNPGFPGIVSRRRPDSANLQHGARNRAKCPGNRHSSVACSPRLGMLRLVSRGVVAVHAVLAVALGQGRSEQVAGTGTDFARARQIRTGVQGSGARQERTCPWNKLWRSGL